MTRSSLSECSPEGRRSGDVGGAGLLTDFHNQLIDAIPKDAAMLRPTTCRTESPRKGAIKRASLPFRAQRGISLPFLRQQLNAPSEPSPSPRYAGRVSINHRGGRVPARSTRGIKGKIQARYTVSYWHVSHRITVCVLN